MKNLFDIIIVGAGASGLFAATQCTGRKVLVIEKTQRPGNKLLLSGSGRCNLTHTGSIKDFLLHYGDHGQFIRKALYAFNNNDLIHFFENLGIKFYIDKNEKVFPDSDNAKDLLKVLLKLCEANQTQFVYQQGVHKIKIADTFSVYTNEYCYESKYLLLATGGITYPKTGSEGEGLIIARSAGHTIISPKPALTPVIVKQFLFKELAGISFYNIDICIYRNEHKIKSAKGDVLFTHQGISGPGILDLSRYIEINDIISLNLAGCTAVDLEEKILNAYQTKGKLSVKNFIKMLGIAERFSEKMFKLLQIPQDTKLAEINKKQRKEICKFLCTFTIKVDSLGGINTAMVTAGGISLDEVNPSTMESRLIKGLYFAGEVLDIDGDTGGYNLQAAFSTAFVAARSMKNAL